MNNLQNKKIHLDNFFKVLDNFSNYSKLQFKGYYYKALLVDPNVRYLKNDFLKGRKESLIKRKNSLLESLHTRTEKEYEESFNITLYNIFKFHLDNFVGRTNTEKTLEEIEKELGDLANLIFDNSPPFRLSVEDTTFSIDESKTKGSQFRVKIIP